VIAACGSMLPTVISAAAALHAVLELFDLRTVGSAGLHRPRRSSAALGVRSGSARSATPSQSSTSHCHHHHPRSLRSHLCSHPRHHPRSLPRSLPHSHPHSRLLNLPLRGRHFRSCHHLPPPRLKSFAPSLTSCAPNSSNRTFCWTSSSCSFRKSAWRRRRVIPSSCQ
jgi:hypothetical protein